MIKEIIGLDFSLTFNLFCWIYSSLKGMLKKDWVTFLSFNIVFTFLHHKITIEAAFSAESLAWSAASVELSTALTIIS